MPRLAMLLASCLLASTLTACGGPDDPGTAQASDDLSSALGAPCMSTASCGKGEVCTTEDGVCNRPPGCGPGMICPAVCYGTCRAATAPSPSPCKVDPDCRAFSDYCGGCSCRALSVREKDPVCTGGIVYCFMNPCQGKEAYCDAGSCALRPATRTTAR